MKTSRLGRWAGIAEAGALAAADARVARQYRVRRKLRDIAPEAGSRGRGTQSQVPDLSPAPPVAE
jgi:hypothetical protein